MIKYDSDDTPLTEAVWRQIGCPDDWPLMEKHAQRLERELAQCRQDAARIDQQRMIFAARLQQIIDHMPADSEDAAQMKLVAIAAFTDDAAMASPGAGANT